LTRMPEPPNEQLLALVSLPATVMFSANKSVEFLLNWKNPLT
jgi:hypothetical protein